jgi:uncharacterized membrane protein (UPF0127 family)
VALSLALALLVACEPRVEEPSPPPSSHTAAATPSPSGSALAGQSAASGAPSIEPPVAPSAAGLASGRPEAGRCIKPTPPTAARTLKRPGPDPGCPADPEKPPKVRTGKVTFPEAKGQSVSVEIAENEHDRQRGLMYRKAMADDHGMIFRMEDRRNQTFWMHNTCIPLDLVYIDDDGTIVGIEENAPTLDDSTFEVGCPSRYVLELNAGWTRKHGVVAGQKVKLEGVAP